MERVKCVKALQHAKNMLFDQKIHFFYPNHRTLNMYALASFGFGFRQSKITRNDTKILCIRLNHVLVEFLQTRKTPQLNCIPSPLESITLDVTTVCVM